MSDIFMTRAKNEERILMNLNFETKGRIKPEIVTRKHGVVTEYNLIYNDVIGLGGDFRSKKPTFLRNHIINVKLPPNFPYSKPILTNLGGTYSPHIIPYGALCTGDWFITSSLKSYGEKIFYMIIMLPPVYMNLDDPIRLDLRNAVQYYLNNKLISLPLDTRPLFTIEERAKPVCNIVKPSIKIPVVKLV